MALDCDSGFLSFYSRRAAPQTRHILSRGPEQENKQKQTAAEDRIHHIGTTSRENKQQTKKK